MPRKPLSFDDGSYVGTTTPTITPVVNEDPDIVKARQARDVAAAMKASKSTAKPTKAELTKQLNALKEKTKVDVAAAETAVSKYQEDVKTATTALEESTTAASASEDTILDIQPTLYSAAPNLFPQYSAAPAVDPLVQLQKQQEEAARKDAFALLEDTFNQYGLGELADSIKRLMREGVGPNQAALMLKTDPAYNGPYLKRFAGNVTRQKAGLNVLSEAEYINLENQYSNLLSAYGVKQLATRDEFANLIGNDVSPTEVNKRLDLAVTQVKNADPNIMASLRQYYPQLKDSDLVSYMLAPDKTLPALQEMVTTGQINAAAMQQGLGVDVGRATQLARLGVDQQAARQGYEKVATVLPTGQKLSQIYGEAAIPYSQTTAEQEFLEGNASAARKRRQLAALEEGTFSGRSGVDMQTGSSLQRSIQGKF